MKLFLVRFMLLSSLVVAPIVFSAETERTWTSIEGKSFAGTLTSATEDAASVRRSDGRFFDIPLTSLSEADRKYVARFLTDLKRVKGLTEGPFADRVAGEWVKVPKEEHGLVFQIYGTSKLKRLKEPFPLFVHLHGAGARAADVDTGKVEIAPQRLASEEFYDDFPCLIVVPLCPVETYWGDHKAALEGIIDTLCDSLPIDRNRIYLSGYSMGARGIGSLIESRPNLYAAALFADGEAKMSWVDTTDTALWFTFSGERDLEGAQKVANAYSAAGKTAKFEGFPDHTHNQIHWTLAKTEGVYEWCFSQVRSANQEPTEK